MLADEFEEMRVAINTAPSLHLSELERYATVIRDKWMAVAFMEVGDQCLCRYYNFHLKALLNLINEYPPSSPTLLSLLDDLLKNYFTYLDLSCQAPEPLVKRELGGSGFALSLNDQGPVGQWLSKFYSGVGKYKLTIRQVYYLKEVTKDLSKSLSLEELIRQLITLNFNHTGLFNAITLILKGRDRRILQEHFAKFRSVPVRNDVFFDPAWVTLREMVCSWLKEEIRLLKTRAPAVVEKLHFGTSVAHLAFLIRLFHEEGLLPEPSLTRLFRQVVAVSRTKKQEAISEGSFSKEFYATDQHTAGRVRDLLQRMLVRLNRRFFP